ncbi:respiratory chain complex I subunit 1 family protein [Methanococcus voltae]|uniref:Energy-converting hydrogenase A subunit J n=2 Tax=Methanococcus voltae TaxID=2188 RepID=A0A8J7RP65_METVO|nr:NADH-quinone oxidoreductase subunit H [Methanococcus voltae]MBP2172866.1 energy-converting hydrogenase A subunit J [Methanococcus voltae]MBP2201724.1 energy-converting hydrogenase A subunit J [Methanococcus voltae]MCS3922512.1 energy-converting hydrogenase A subunit J [Methanococcus voltae PS]
METIGYMVNSLAYTLYAFLIGGTLLGFHRKVIARIQGRPGPPIIQYLIQTTKFYFKEITFPSTAGNPLYVFVALMDMMVWMSALSIAVIFQSSLLIMIGLYILQKIVEHGCGLSSGSPYGKMGGVRSVFSAAAEVPLFAAVGIIYIVTNTLMIGDIINYQVINGPLIFQLPLCAFALFVLVVSKAPFSPFGIVKGKDIVSGYMTEHYGLLHGIIMIGDALAWFVLLWLFMALFLGPLVLNPAVALLSMVGLTFIVSFICALSPLLTPHHSVMIQISIASLTLIDLAYRLIH